jgi:hypothetical protein
MYEIIQSRTLLPLAGEPQYPAWDQALERVKLLNQQGKGVVARKVVTVLVVDSQARRSAAMAALINELNRGDVLHVFTDAWTRGNPGMGGCRVVNKDRKILTSRDSTEKHSNNFFELYGLYLAAEYAVLHYNACKKKVVIWSDSQTALAWIQAGSHKALADQESITALLKRIQFHQETGAFEFRKWDTEQFGEILADYGRK